SRRIPMAARLTGVIAAAAVLAAASASQMTSRAAPTLDYDFFKSRVEPVFLQKRDGHTRCYICHAESNNAFRLDRMSPAANAWRVRPAHGARSSRARISRWRPNG